MDGEFLTSFLAAAVRVATPLLLAALGETLTQRGGMINLSIEGAMLAGALGAAVGASAGGLWLGLLGAVAAGALVALIFGLVTIVARAEQIIAGTAITLGAIGLTGIINRHTFGPSGVGLSLPTFPVVPLPVLSRIPLIGPAFFAQTGLTYAAYLLVAVLGWLLFRTRWGLRLRAAGESAEKAHAAGVHVASVRFAAVLIGGLMSGLAGGSLVLAQVGTFAEKMTAGRGFIAIAIVALGSWHPGRVFGASLFFGAAMALQFLAQSALTGVPYQFFLMLPYGLTLLVLAGVIGRVEAPEGLGR